MTAVSKNVYINKLDEIDDKYNKTYHGTIKMKPADIKGGTSIDTYMMPILKYTYYVYTYIYLCIIIAHNKKDPKFKVGDHVRISKYKTTLGKGYKTNWFEEAFVINKVKHTVI